ncbi:amidohydrolase family protein [Paenibacillus sp. OAS669]|uniref:amidohydrolase family protein n=1 Tax=Paenibacillus sp. OAS669 TaxID=2663821 RepID=UPI00178C0D9D|nr:amidohydrolase family protein [Paenibacillus sp. OAS669]MBE1440721.1 L-fuconolactonase [Paenibacillus sp. OAS669]
MKIDAHQHYWKLDRGDYGWLTPDSGVLYRDYLPEQLNDHLKANGISKTVVVQAAPTLAETEFMLSLAEQSETIAGVVGWLDLEDSSYKEHYARLKQNPYFKGIRVMLQDIDMEYAFRPAVLEALRFFEREQFPIDLLIKMHQLEDTVKLLKQLPDLRGVIDHIAKPFISEQQLEPWSTYMAQIASDYPNIYCKLSGMVTEADHQNWREEHFVPYVQHVVSRFGPQRIMYGSDWPVCLLAAEYDDVYKLLESTLPDSLTPSDLEDVFGHNAARFYRL